MTTQNGFISMKIYHPPCTFYEEEKGFGIIHVGVNPDGTVYISGEDEGFDFHVFWNGKLLGGDIEDTCLMSELFEWHETHSSP